MISPLQQANHFIHRCAVNMDELQSLAHKVVEVIDHTTSGDTFSSENFNTLALELADAQRRTNPVLDAYWKQTARHPWTHWRQIPPLPVNAFKHYDITAIPPKARTCVFHSSGTTGQKRSCHWHHEESLRVYRHALKAWFARHLLNKEDSSPKPEWLMFSLTPLPTEAPHSSLVFMLNAVIEQWGAPNSRFLGYTNKNNDWMLDTGVAVSLLEKTVQQGTPVILLGTAFNFVHLLDELIRLNKVVPLPSGSRLMETGGYKGRSRSIPVDELHQALSKHLGIPRNHVVREYGMCELSSQAYDRIAGTPPAEPTRFVFPPWVKTRIISPETGMDCQPGEPGLLCIYDLANIWSVMAVQTADLAIGDENGFELLGRASSAEPRGCSLMVKE